MLGPLSLFLGKANPFDRLVDILWILASFVLPEILLCEFEGQLCLIYITGRLARNDCEILPCIYIRRLGILNANLLIDLVVLECAGIQFDEEVSFFGPCAFTYKRDY